MILSKNIHLTTATFSIEYSPMTTFFKNLQIAEKDGNKVKNNIKVLKMLAYIISFYLFRYLKFNF